MIVGELILTLVLLSGAGFMIRSFMQLYAMDFGIEAEGIATMEIYLPLTQYPELEPRWELYQAFLDRVSTAPEIHSGALVTALPAGGGGGSPLELDGVALEEDVARPITTLLTASEGYFEAVGIDLLRGRSFVGGDGAPGAEVAIVNQRFVELHFPDGDPIGRQIRVAYEGHPIADAPWLTVVGVTPTIRQAALEERQPDPVVYLPLQMNPSRTTFFVARTRTGIAAVAPAVRESMRLVNPDLPVFNVRTLEDALAEGRWAHRTFGTMFGFFAAIALILSAVGLYSVTAHSVIQRIREFAIRVSLGAEPRHISWLALRRVLIQLSIGLPLGMLGAFGVGRLLESLLVQTGPADPLTLGGVVLLMGVVAVLACLWPAARAGRVDPVTVLRVE
jgi:predicted permease